MTKTSKSSGSHPPTVEDITLERSLEGLFRLGANRRFESRQSVAVGAVVTRAGYAVLRSLSDLGTTSLREVADACSMDSAAASRQVVALVEEGLVLRRASDGDARALDLSLTDKGRDVYERIVRYRLEHLASVLKDWTEEDRTVLAQLVSRLSADLAATPLTR